MDTVEPGGHGLAVDEHVDNRDRAVEMLLMGLRLREGIELSRLSAPFGDLVDNQAVEKCIANDLLVMHGDKLRVTKAGRPVLNALLREILL